jgi:hypothetical protein
MYPKAMWATFGQLDHGEYAGGGWRRAFRSVAGISLPEETKHIFLSIWLRYGDHIRLECGSDLDLIIGLRAILPPYEGSMVHLYRGEGVFNRRRRTYGLSWSADREVADSFAKGIWRQTQGGSVLLETVAPADAIICTSDDFGESEFLVDRRRLHRVFVLQRYSELPV